MNKIETAEQKKKREVDEEKNRQEEELKKMEELTPMGSYNEDDISIYYDYTDEESAEETPGFFKHLAAMCKERVINNELTFFRFLCY